MRNEVLVTATMRDGSVIREIAWTFSAFTGLVLAFRADPDCLRLEWKEAALASAA